MMLYGFTLGNLTVYGFYFVVGLVYICHVDDTGVVIGLPLGFGYLLYHFIGCRLDILISILRVTSFSDVSLLVFRASWCVKEQTGCKSLVLDGIQCNEMCATTVSWVIQKSTVLFKI